MQEKGPVEMALRADDVDLGRDRDLVARFQSGDPDAFDDLYRRYFDRLHRFCMRHTRDSHEAEEVAQEAFVKAFRSMHSLEGERRFYPWMTVIAKRITIDRHRKHFRVELTDQPDLGSVEPDIDHLFAAVDAQHVRQALGKVGPRHREVLLLREAQGLSYAQIADQLGVPVTTVEALLHRARKALRREFATVTGERRGLLGLPVLGWLTTRAGTLRARVGERWAEIGTAVAPIAVGAVTAAVVLVPGSGATPTRITTTEPAAATSVARPAPTPSQPVVVDTPSLDADRPAAAVPGSGAPDAPDGPTVTAGPVDVFTGPGSADRARTEAEEMPLHRTVGPVTGGADGPLATDDVDVFVDETIRILTGPDPSSGARP